MTQIKPSNNSKKSNVEIITVKLSNAYIISELIQETLGKVNTKDYMKKQIKVWKKADIEDKVKERLKDKSKYTCIAVEEDKIVGVGAVKRDEITAIYVKASRIRAGVGSKILQFLEKKALKDKITKLKLNSSLTAFKFYNKYGYLELRKSIHYVEGKNIPVSLWRKRLFK